MRKLIVLVLLLGCAPLTPPRGQPAGASFWDESEPDPSIIVIFDNDLEALTNGDGHFRWSEVRPDSKWPPVICLPDKRRHYFTETKQFCHCGQDPWWR
jgi:hypothetical protein